MANVQSVHDHHEARTTAIPLGSSFEAEVRELLPADRIVDDPLRLVTMGTDASCYRLTPQLIVLVEDEDEVRRVIDIANETGTAITFRAAGTSLSGQAVTDSVLVKLGHNGWRDWSVNDDASLITTGPALTGAQVNRRLVAKGRKIGPDPASINSAMIGGIAANNASGMCCGIAQNSYQTLSSMRVVLADGTVLDTADRASRQSFEQNHSGLLNELRDLGEATRKDHKLSGRIRKKYAIKNTMGYALNALIDFEDPIDILQHLMIGSEGTLGFMSQITYRTVADPRHKASALAFFPDIRSACEAVAILKSAPVAAVELMDYRSLKSVRGQPGMPAILETMPEGTSALLIEVQGETHEEALAKAAEAAGAIAGVKSLEAIEFTTQAARYVEFWKMRKGLFPAVGAVRETGTTVIIEDVAVTTDQLADAVIDLQALFEKHSYDEAIIFGHALEGNVHFVFTQGFESEADVARYGAFIDDVTDLIVSKYDGSLKAEHSTGRNMAPFVEMEWGVEAYRLMQQIKSLLDPKGILNPGVVLNDDPRVHLNDLKPMPAADEIVDKCIECGFCETTCPSRAVTLTPRQRIVGLREIARLKAEGKAARPLRARMEKDYQHQGVDTCAGDGLCSVACPVGIDTGSAMRAVRSAKHGAMAHFIANRLAKNFGFVAGLVRVGLLANGALRSVIGNRNMARLFGAANWLTRGLVPKWTDAMPTSAPPPVHYLASAKERLVYFPSCAARVFGPAPGSPDMEPLPPVVTRLLQKAGYDVVMPDKVDRLCCGMPFKSKGFPKTAGDKTRELVKALKAASRDGQDTIVFDTSPCVLEAREAANAAGLKTIDLIDALGELVLGKVDINPSQDAVAIHTTCSARRMGQEIKFKAIAETFGGEVIVPPDIQCCGFAGDKGFTTPELNASALRHLEASLPDACERGYSTSRTCEIGLSTHSGRPYQSIAYLADRCTTQKAAR
ncbi:MAG: FAD-binding oxidoreductase [Alphaproteobacteria bacterium]|nr:FAD-binding oxidoreductase [Alphaproteobacteria bacterium]